MDSACQEIQWLLEDEIASALRLVPITEENLDRVAEHICSVSDSKNCIFTKENFNFVTGLSKNAGNGLLLFYSELAGDTFHIPGFRIKQIGKKYLCILDSPSVENYDDLMLVDQQQLGVMEQIKEKAKITRKGLGHRRSHSDFNSRSHKVLTENVKLGERTEPRGHTTISTATTSNALPRATLRKRISSWPVYLNTLELETDFFQDANTNNRHQNQNMRPYWEMNGDDEDDDEDNEGSDEMISFRSSQRSSSKGNSSSSPFPYHSYDTRELFQRSISFSEYSSKMERRTETRRRYNSLPNINLSGNNFSIYITAD